METKRRIYCFPYAGGSSLAFRDIAKRLSSIADVVVLDYPGHGTRFGEKFADNMEELAKESARQIFIDMQQNACQKCIFLGHSMGALVAYETAKMIEDVIMIDKLILCGSLPPDMEREDYSSYDRDAAFDKFFMMGWIPDEVRDEPELYDIFSEIIYSDIKVLSTIDVEKENNLIHIPLSIYYGEDDRDCDRLNMKGWMKKTNKKCNIHSMTGDHFFLFEYPKMFCKQIIEEELLV